MMKKKKPISSDENLDSEINEPEMDESGLENEGNDSEEVTEPEKDPIEIMNEKLSKKDEEIAELKNEFLRYKADTENFKKRLRKEKEDFSQYANERLLKELTLINDNLERALSAPNPTVKSLQEGVEMILKQFHSFLEKENVQSIEALGKKFDPNLHEVMCQVESEEHEENIITEEYSKGYQLSGRILRPSKVVVAKTPEKKTPDSTDKDDIENSEEGTEFPRESAN
jgi:molecular chaperone GrpE